jgi:hypothetical protein
MTAEELMARAAWCAHEAANATDPIVKAELLKLRAAYVAQAEAEVHATAERMTGIPAPSFKRG